MCRICHRDFSSVEEMNEHLKLCQKSLSCQKCDKICDSIQLFEIHVDICDSDGKFKCYVCGKKYKNEKECYSHTKTCKGKLSCVNCNKKFKNWKLLLEHGQKVHQKFVCNTCNKVFEIRSELLQHMTTH